MPPWGWWPLALVGIALYGGFARERRGSAAFGTAFLFALGWFVPSLAWMWFLTVPGYVLVCMLFAALHGVAAIVADRVGTGSQRGHTLALVACHSLVETLRLSWPFGGVPLATLGISQVSSPLLSLAPLGGVILITCATFWIALSRTRVRAVLAVAVLIVAARVWHPVSSTGRQFTMTIVQGGGEQGTHAVDTDPKLVFQRHLALTRTLVADPRRQAVVWPENVVNVSGGGLFIDSTERLQIGAEARRLGVPFVVGVTESAGGDAFTNAQVVVAPDGEVLGRYDKVRRVPFGEYMPFRAALAALGAPVDLVPRDARPGTARGYLDVADERAAVAISWEIFFGGRVNEGVVDGAGFVINPTNGSSYTWSILQTQQLASSRIRAREQDRWVVQVAPTGFSAFIAPDGAVVDRSGIGKPFVAERSVQVREGRTLYSRFGNAPYIAGLFALVVLAQRRSSRHIRTARS